MSFLQWFSENRELVLICLGLCVNAAGLLYNVIKYLRAGGLKNAKGLLALRDAARRFECEAENTAGLTGAQKLALVLSRLREFCAQMGYRYDAEQLTAAVEEDIAFSREVNATKSEELE